MENNAEENIWVTFNVQAQFRIYICKMESEQQTTSLRKNLSDSLLSSTCLTDLEGTDSGALSLSFAMP